MTQELNRIEIDLVPLTLFSQRISAGWGAGAGLSAPDAGGWSIRAKYCL
ncbi:hypothetical protein [Rhizobium yanglingense]